LDNETRQGLKMKPLLKIAFFLPLLILLASCAKFAPVPDNEAYNRVMQNKVLIVGMSGEQPPFNFVVVDKTAIGFDVDVAEIVAKELGVKLQISIMPFDDLQNALKTGAIDAIISGFSVTKEREETLRFSLPYAVTGKSLVFKRKTGVKIRETTGFNDESVHIAALAGSTSYSFAETKLPDAKLTPIQHYEQALVMLRGDEVDALLADLTLCELALIRDTQNELAVLRSPLNVEDIAIAFNKNEVMLQDKSSTAIKALVESKELFKIQEKWFKDALWLALLP
jgi:ABC-type amino acid transport substrate-binding protein